MKLSISCSFALLTSLVFSTAAFADWAAPIQCAVETKVGESAPKIEALSGMTEGRLTKKIESSSVNSSGNYIKEIFKYEILVRLISTNIYELSIKDLDQNSTVGATAVVPNGDFIEKQMLMTKDYPVVNGMGALFPRFKISLKCQLRSQATSSIPDLTPGPPSEM